MKQIIIIMLLALNVLTAKAQYNGVQKHKESGYTFIQVILFINSKTTLADNWNQASADLLNAGLIEAGESLRITKDNIEWANGYVKDSIIYGPILNSYTIGDKIIYFLDQNLKGAEVKVFCWGRCHKVWYKIKCMNLVNVQQIFPKIITAPVTKVDSLKNQPKGGNTYVTNNNYYISNQQPQQPQQDYNQSSCQTYAVVGYGASNWNNNYSQQYCGGNNYNSNQSSTTVGYGATNNYSNNPKPQLGSVHNGPHNQNMNMNKGSGRKR
jgi:hypothetical protein